MKSGFLLAGLILALWPGSLSSPGFFGPPVLLVAGGGDVNYLAVARGPERVLDVGRSVPVDLPPMESETETQTRAAHYYGEGDWAGEAAAAGDRGLRQPSTRGEATYYHPSLAWGLMRIGDRQYTPSDASIAAVGVDVVGQPTVELGRMLEVCHQEADTCIVVSVVDTGRFPRHDLDLSEAAWLALSGGKPLTAGRLEIEWRVLE